MPIIAKQGNEGGFTPISEGVHTAICYAIIDLGEQYSEKYNKTNQKIMITWEIPQETITVEGKEVPRSISKEYSLSLHEKSGLRKDLQAWRGRAFTDEELEGFDLRNVLGKGCQLQIIHSDKGGKTYTNIASIMGLPKGMRVDPPANDIIYLDMTEDGFEELLAKIPNWIQEKVRSSDTYKGITASGHTGTEEDDDDGLPF